MAQGGHRQTILPLVSNAVLKDGSALTQLQWSALGHESIHYP